MNNAENIEVIDPATIPVSEAEFEEIQTERFKNSLSEILGVDVQPKIKFSEMLLQEATLNYDDIIYDNQLLHLIYFAESWNQTLYIVPSDAGLKISFTLKTT